MRSVLRKAVRVLAAIGETMGCKYETQKDHFSFLPRRNLRGFSRRSLGEELQNRAAAENRRGGGNREKPQITRIGQPDMPPYGQPLCNNHAADDPEKRPRSPTSIAHTCC
jgi:hypothetical protein